MTEDPSIEIDPDIFSDVIVLEEFKEKGKSIIMGLIYLCSLYNNKYRRRALMTGWQPPEFMIPVYRNT